MPDLPVVAVITAKPGSEDVVREALGELVGPTRDEDGCLSYSLYESTTAPGVFVTVESWRDTSDLDAHVKSPHMAAAMGKAGEHLVEAPVIHQLAGIDVA